MEVNIVNLKCNHWPVSQLLAPPPTWTTSSLLIKDPKINSRISHHQFVVKSQLKFFISPLLILSLQSNCSLRQLENNLNIILSIRRRWEGLLLKQQLRVWLGSNQLFHSKKIFPLNFKKTWLNMKQTTNSPAFKGLMNLNDTLLLLSILRLWVQIIKILNYLFTN